MQKEDKRIEQNKIKQVITESFLKLDNLLTKINDNKPDVNAKNFFRIVKYTFGKLFDIHYEYTYEQLIYKLTTIDKKLKSLSSAIQLLKNKIDNTFIEEKDNPNLKEKIDELEEKLTKEYISQKFYTKLKSVLMHGNINSLIKELSHKISDLEYGNQEISNTKIKELIEIFKSILDQIMAFEEIKGKKKKESFFARIFGLGTHYEKKDEKKLKIEEPELVLKPKEGKLPETKLPPEPKSKTGKSLQKKEEKKPKGKLPKKIQPKEKFVTKKDALKKKIEIKEEKIKPKQPPTKDLLKISIIIDQVNQMIEKEKVEVAKHKYLQALKHYKKLPVKEKEEIYRLLLKLYHSIINVDMNIKR